MENDTDPEKTMTETQLACLPDAELLIDLFFTSQNSALGEITALLKKKDLLISQFLLLAYLDGEDFLTMGGVAKKMGHTDASATGLINKLEKLKYVERKYREGNKKVIEVRITDKGRAFVREMYTKISVALGTVLENENSKLAETLLTTQEALGKLKITPKTK